MTEKKTNKKRSAGVVVVRLEDGEYKFLMLRTYSMWEAGGKGKQDEGETDFETALRELEEETSLTPKDLDFRWGKASYTTESYAKGKTATYYLAQTNVEIIEIPINPEIGKREHNEYKWLTYDEAHAVSGPRIQKVLAWAKALLDK